MQPTGRLDNDTPAALAGDFVALAEKMGAALDYSPESLALADQILDVTSKTELKDDNAREHMVDLIGSYYGEVIRRNLGGDWYSDIEPEGGTALVLNAAGAPVHVWCYSTVAKEIFDGADKNLSGLYKLLAANFGGR